MDNLNLNQIIEELKQYIEKETGNRVHFETINNGWRGAFIDFPNWLGEDRRGLPKIIYKEAVDKVHVLHELIHLEKFFIDGYSIIVCKDGRLHSTSDFFKNITEDYVAHKEIKNKYNLNPIDEGWFKGKDNLQISDDLEIAANLINYWAFSEFITSYRIQYSEFLKKAKRNKIYAYLRADRVIKCLSSANYKDVSAINQCTEEIVKIFAPGYYEDDDIYPAIIKKDVNGYWQYYKCSSTANKAMADQKPEKTPGTVI